MLDGVDGGTLMCFLWRGCYGFICTIAFLRSWPRATWVQEENVGLPVKYNGEMCTSQTFKCSPKICDLRSPVWFPWLVLWWNFLVFSWIVWRVSTPAIYTTAGQLGKMMQFPRVMGYMLKFMKAM